MNYLFLNWRDRKNPRSGGAEVVTEEIIKRLVQRGNTVTLFSTMFPGAPKTEIIDGYTVIRRGREYTVHLWALLFWFKTFKHQKFDVVVDQVHGIPFFTPLYVRNTKIVAFIHEVAREIWLHMYRFPIGWLGYKLEPLFYKPYKNTNFITVSNATKRDLISVGIDQKQIHIIPEAVTTTPLLSIPPKDTDPTIIFVGRVAKMKGVGDLIAAYLIAKKTIPNLKLWIVGGGDTYKAELMQDCANDPDITFHGFVSEEEKNSLYTRAHILSSASVKEGFGLVVIEAACHGTPAVVYNVDGFNEAVLSGKTGVLTDTRPQALADGFIQVLTNQKLYQELQKNALEYSRGFNFDKTADSFEKIILPPPSNLSTSIFSTLENFYFLTSYFWYKLILFFEVVSPRYKLVANEWFYSFGKLVKFCARNETLYPISKIVTKFGIFNIRKVSFDSIWTSPAFERRDINRLFKMIECQIKQNKKILFLDIGADLGTYSITVGNAFRKYNLIDIHAFEPARDSYGLLSKNISENNLSKKVNLHNFALGNSEGTIKLFHNINDSGSNSIESADKCNELSYELVTVKCLDQVKIDFNKYDIIFSKIDVEGAETKVLIGASKLLSSPVEKYFLVEDFVDNSIISFLQSKKAILKNKLTSYNSWWYLSGG